MNFIYSFFNQPSIIIGLISLIGLITLKKPIGEIIDGTLKTVIGFVILSQGGGIISGALENLGPAFESAFNVRGVIPTNEAVIGLAEDLFGLEMALIMAFGFIVNILMARFSRFKYIFLTGHHVLFMSGLLAAVLSTLGFQGTELIVIGSIILGASMTLSPAAVQPYYRKVTGNDTVAMGHMNAINYSISATIGKLVGNPDNSTEDVDVPESLSFFRDNTITTALVMMIIYLVTYAFADKSILLEMSGGDNVYVFGIVQAMIFTAGFVVVLQGVRMMLGEIVPAFKGISEKIVPDAIPALDVPVIFPFAPNAVLVGFVASVVGGFIMFLILPVIGLPVIIPGLIPLFFVGAGVGVLTNKVGGIRGVIVAGIVNGMLLILLPAILLPLMGELGFAGSTFGDADFALVGIIIGYLGEFFGKMGIYVLTGALIIFLIGSNFFPKKKIEE